MEAIIKLFRTLKWKCVFLYIHIIDFFRFQYFILTDFLCHRKLIILVRRMDALGDVICTLPLAKQLRKNHPECRLVFLTTPYCVDILQHCDVCDAIATVRIKSFEPSFNCFGIIKKIYMPLTDDERNLPVSRNHLSKMLADSCSVAIDDFNIKLKVSDSERILIRKKFQLDRAKSEGKAIFVINCGPTWKVREWPSYYWQELVNLIHRDYDAKIFQIGVHVAGKLNSYDEITGTINLASSLSIKELISLIAESDLLISIDSGPVHIAGVIGTPVLGLFGALTPSSRLPINGVNRSVSASVDCAGCHHSNPIGHWMSGCPNNIRCMQELTPNAVFDVFKSMAEQILKKEHHLL
jgi:ADP-heptose:LPS heptosyltransferase